MKIHNASIIVLLRATSLLSSFSSAFISSSEDSKVLDLDEDLIIGATSVSVESSSAEFDHWIFQHSKSYSNDSEKKTRLRNWMATNNKIQSHNKRYAAGQVSWYMKHNEYSDMTPDEFADYFHLHNKVNSLEKVMGGFQIVEDTNSETNTARKLRGQTILTDTSEPLDYDDMGFVTAAKNQGNCGSCWAFAAVGALESVRAKYLFENDLLDDRTEALVVLSDQEMIDCAGANTGNYGCNGGWPKSAISRYTAKQNGVCSEEDYPYEAKDNLGCRTSNCENIPYTTFGKSKYVTSVRNNERSAPKIDEALDINPLIVAVVVEPYLDWMNFGGGIYNDPACGDDSYTGVNHALLLIGRGEENGISYWRFKNSWGKNWGEDGYIRFERQWDLENNDGVCGMLRYGMTTTLDVVQSEK